MGRNGPRGLLVSGTDTGVGKTYVACLLARRLADDGMTVRPFKPVESGCVQGADGRPFPADAAALRDAACCDLSLADVCPYPLAAPLSPHLAARIEGHGIDIDRIRAMIAACEGESDIVLVEGAGGITVEIAEGYPFSRLAADLGYHVLVVADNRLGVLNQVALTVRYLEVEGIGLAGVALSDVGPEGCPATASNPEELARTCGSAYLGRVPHGTVRLPDDVYVRLRRRLLF